MVDAHLDPYDYFRYRSKASLTIDAFVECDKVQAHKATLFEESTNGLKTLFRPVSALRVRSI